MPIRTYKSAFITLFVTLLLVTVASIVANSYLLTRRAALELSEKVIHEVSQRVIERTGNIFLTAEAYVQIDALIAGKGPILENRDELLKLFWRQIHLTPHHLSVFVADDQGNFVQSRKLPQLVTRVIDRRGGIPREDLVYRDVTYRPIARVEGQGAFEPRERPWYVNTTGEPRVHWSELYRFSGTGKLGITASYPVTDGSGRIRKVLGLDIPVENIAEFLSQQRVYRRSVALIVDAQDRVIAYPDDLSLRQGKPENRDDGLRPIGDLDHPALASIWEHHKGRTTAGESPGVFAAAVEGEYYFARVQPFPEQFGHHWNLVYVVPEASILNSTKRLLSESFVIAVIILFVAIFVVYTLALRFSRPIAKLARNARLIRNFRLSEVGEVKSGFGEIRNMDESIRSVKQSLMTFLKYVPNELVQQSIGSDQEVKLGTGVSELSLFFSSLPGFSDLCREREPSEITEQLSERLEEVSKIIVGNGGTIDKYVGDTVAAFWGAPIPHEDDPVRACRAAFLSMRAIAEINHKRTMEGLPPLESIFAVHTGEAIVGNIGSETRSNYTAVGDNVDIALDLCQLNDRYGTRILISEATWRHVNQDYQCRLIDQVELGNQATNTRLYELQSESSEASRATERLPPHRYEQAFARYQARRWGEAEALLEELAEEYPQDKPVRMLLSRCRKARKGKAHPAMLDETWNGSVPLDAVEETAPEAVTSENRGSYA